jgi:haloalkane dehalogenase
VIAPDLFGFGKSDKPAEIEDHNFAFHFQSLENLLETLDLQNVTLVCQDWGGILGLPLAAKHSERFSRLVIMNTGLPTGERPPTEGFLQWMGFAKQTGRGLIAGKLVEISSMDKPSEDVIAAYDAPFPDESYRAGVAAMPLLIALSTEHPTSPYMIEARERLQQWQKPVLIMFSDKDPVTAGGEKSFQKMIPTAKDYPFYSHRRRWSLLARRTWRRPRQSHCRIHAKDGLNK